MLLLLLALPLHVFSYEYIYPPTSSERRACETTAKPCLPESKPKQQGISPSSPGRPRPPAAQARMTQACSSQGWMVQDLINYSSYRGHSSLPQDATGLFSMRSSSPPHAPFCPPGPSDWRSRLHGSAKWLIGAPCLTQWSPHATQSLPSSEPNEAKGSKMEPKVIAIQAQRSPSRATWSSKHPILSDSSLRGRRQRR